ncbi:MAG: hypothetical protein F6J93_29815 [Oscillatoria sp. SIO1A7]|nr:hypothetical protein [Oscillatoria sp. SIO1A7]
MNVSYRAEIIQKLTAREAIRKRPRMYVGATNGQGILYLVCELIHNSIEEALAGYCNQIDVDLNYDGSIAVTDNGRGISTELYPKTEKSFLESVMTTMFARDCGSNERYKVTGGWNGFGLAVVNALSEWVKITVWREGKTSSQKYERGIALTELEVIPSTEYRAGNAARTGIQRYRSL